MDGVVSNTGSLSERCDIPDGWQGLVTKQHDARVGGKICQSQLPQVPTPCPPRQAVLDCPGHFSPSERVFSVASRCCSKVRSQIDPIVVEELEFLHDNWKDWENNVRSEGRVFAVTRENPILVLRVNQFSRTC